LEARKEQIVRELGAKGIKKLVESTLSQPEMMQITQEGHGGKT
jgi:hypothetical protein